MRATWVGYGNLVNGAKLRNHGITDPYFDGRDPQITSSYLDTVKAAGFNPGFYFAWNWFPNADGPSFARIIDTHLKAVGWRGNAPICVDIETHDIDGYVVPFLREWRRLRPYRKLDWTMEGMQGGLLDTPERAQAIEAANIRLAPQFYNGNMDPINHSPILDLLMCGFPAQMILGMYDAARLPYRWTGYAFTQERLP